MRPGLGSRAAVVAAAALLTVSACGSDAKEKPLELGDPDPTTSSAADSALEPPTVPAAANDKAGRVAFATYVIKAFEYSFATNDPAPIEAVSMKSGVNVCGTCEGYADYLERQKAKGFVREPATLPIVRLLDQGEVQKGVSVVDVFVNRPALADVDGAGTRHRPQAAVKGFLYEIGMHFQDGAWHLTGWLEKAK